MLTIETIFFSSAESITDIESKIRLKFILCKVFDSKSTRLYMKRAIFDFKKLPSLYTNRFYRILENVSELLEIHFNNLREKNPFQTRVRLQASLTPPKFHLCSIA